MAVKRTCFMCGTEYEWCNTCHDFDATETWKYLYHDKECLDISKIWYAYRGNEISKEEARKRMDKYPNMIALILENDSNPANEIKEIYNVPKQKLTEETDVENVTDEEQSVEEKVDNSKMPKSRAKSSGTRKNNKN